MNVLKNGSAPLHHHPDGAGGGGGGGGVANYGTLSGTFRTLINIYDGAICVDN